MNRWWFLLAVFPVHGFVHVGSLQGPLHQWRQRGSGMAATDGSDDNAEEAESEESKPKHVQLQVPTPV